MTGRVSSEKEEADDGIRVSLEERRWFIHSGGCQAHVRTRRQPSPNNCQLLAKLAAKRKPSDLFSEAKLLEDSVLTQTGWTRTSPAPFAPFTGS